MASQTLNQKIQNFYDASSLLWEEVWGEHMHHGYYGENGAFPRDHYQAQMNMIEKILEWGQIETQVKSIIDIGCGIGGSSVYLAEKLGAAVTGITLSPRQAKRAVDRSSNKKATQFMVADALYPPFKLKSFDLVWSLESAEHFPDKRRFLEASFKLLKPGGRLLMATWCRRPTPPALTEAERDCLKLLCKAYNLPEMISIQEFSTLASDVGFSDLESADWTEAVQPFWTAVIRSALIPRNMKKLIKTGWPVLKGALAMPLMIQGYQSGLLKFGLLKGTKL